MTRTQLMAMRIMSIVGAIALIAGIVIFIVDYNTVGQVCEPGLWEVCHSADPSPRGLVLGFLGVTVLVVTAILWVAMTPRNAPPRRLIRPNPHPDH